MRYGSVCSGIEAASVAWEPLGWEPAWFCEIDPFASALLAHRFPRVPNHGDFTRLLDPAHPVHASPIDILVGGTPCQDFSVAGLRAGVEGERGSLTLDFCRLVGVLRPKWVVWENVPGVLSSDGGRALGAFLGALAELGYGFAYRVLDAQYFGLAQRRKRVFVVGCAGAQSSRAGAVLLEPEGVRGDPPARRKARKEAPGDAGGRAAEPGGAVAFNGYARTVGDVATPLMAEDYKKVEIGVLVPGVMAFDYKQSGGDAVLDMTPTLRATPHANTWANGGGHVGIVNVEHGLHTSGNLDEVSEPLTASEYKGHSVVLQPKQEAFAFQPRIGRNGRGQPEPISPTLNGADAGATSDMRPCVVQIEPSDTIGFYPTGGTHGVSAIEDRSPTLKLGSGQGGNAPGVCFKASHFTRGKDGAPSEISPPLSADADRGDQDTLVFTGDGIVADPISANEHKTYTPEGTTFRLHNCVSQPPVSMRESGPGYWLEDEVSGTLDANMGMSGHANRVATLAQPPTMAVRRLTPRECERLQGFPDDWTLIPYRKGESSDSNRYRALGNSMAVPCMFWIGARIAQVDGAVEAGRVAHGVAARVDRLRCLGNGQVPAVARLAWRTLTEVAP